MSHSETTTTTATAIPVAAGATETSPDLDVRIVPIVQVEESPYNPRRLFNTEKLNELAASVKEQGIINPLVTRAVNAHFELVGGARRRRAAEMAGLTHVPIIVRELTDVQAREIALIDNAQREDVHPMHEALSYQELLTTAEWDIEKLASRMGKHERHIFKRLQICKLIEPLQQIFVDGYLTLGAAYSVSRIDADQQARLRNAFFSEEKDEDRWYTINEHEADRWIQHNVLTILDRAIWELDDAELVPAAGSCTACAKRTKANTALFEEVEQEDDRCMDPACFRDKREAFLTRKREKLAKQKKGYLEISDHYRSGDENKLLGSNSYVVVPRGECEFSKDALVVEGEVGRVRHVCADKQCKRHQQFLRRGGGHPSANRDLEREKLAEQETAIRTMTLQAILRRYEAPTREHLNLTVKEMFTRLNHDLSVQLLKIYGQEAPKGGFHSDSFSTFAARIPQMTDAEVYRLMIAITLVDDTKIFTYISDATLKDRKGPLFQIGAELGVPLDAIRAHHEEIAKIKAAHKGNARKELMAKLKAPDEALAIPGQYPLAIRTWTPKDKKQQPEEHLVGVVRAEPDAAGYCEVIYPSGQHCAAKPGELRPFVAVATSLPIEEKKPAKKQSGKKGGRHVAAGAK